VCSSCSVAAWCVLGLGCVCLVQQPWGNAIHIAPELRAELARVNLTDLVAEFPFEKQVLCAPVWSDVLSMCRDGAAKECSGLLWRASVAWVALNLLISGCEEWGGGCCNLYCV
jgi:hypothetical protein